MDEAEFCERPQAEPDLPHPIRPLVASTYLTDQ